MNTLSTTAHFPERSAPSGSAPRLTCRCDSLTAVRTALDGGVDCIHIEHVHEGSELAKALAAGTGPLYRAIRYASERGREVSISVPGQIHGQSWNDARTCVAAAVDAGVGTVLLNDPALMLHARAHYPTLRVAFPVPDRTVDAATIALLQLQFRPAEILLPDALTLRMLEQLAQSTRAPLSVHGRTRFQLGRRYAGHASDAARSPAAESAAPRDRFGSSQAAVNDYCFGPGAAEETYTLSLLPQLTRLGLHSIWIEAPRHAPFQLIQVARTWRDAIDDASRGAAATRQASLMPLERGRD